MIKKFSLKSSEYSYNVAFCCCNEADIEHFPKEIFHESELQELSIRKSETSKRDFIRGRLSAKLALKELGVSEDLENLIIAKGVFGQPVVKGIQKENVKVSISHSTKAALAAASFEEFPIGVDIEGVSRDDIDFIKEHLTNAEMEFIPLVFDKEDSNKGLLLAWTVKEAVTKMWNVGLFIDLKAIEIAKVERQKEYFVTSFKNLTRYKALSFVELDCVCTIVMPYFDTFEVA